MKKKYNIALIPTSSSKAFIQLSHQLSKLSNGYLLGEYSLPHITLYKFQAEPGQIDSIWRDLSLMWNNKLMAIDFSHIEFSLFNRSYWVLLLPRQIPILHDLHSLTAKVIKKPVKKSFYPHLTLINAKNKIHAQEIDQLHKEFVPIADSFVLAIGKADNIGQFIEVVKCV